MIGQLTTNQPFDLELTLKCGQGHRWLPEVDGQGIPTGWYNSVLDGDIVSICQDGGGITFNTTADIHGMDYKLRRQFRLDDDVKVIYADLGNRDCTMAELVERYSGLRVMRVDPWECLVFFILSARTDISITQRRMEAIANVLGIPLSDASARHAFPTPSEIDLSGVAALSKMVDLHLGLDKDAKVYCSAIWISSNKLVLDSLANRPFDKVLRELRQLWGVGPKVSNCTALFSLEKLDAFPIDRHVRQNMENMYLKNGLPPTNRLEDSRAYQRVVDWAQEQFGPYAGYASQFLFVDDYPETKRPRHRPS